jgi:hypothetical protein
MPELLSDVIPLSPLEKQLKEQLESVVRSGFVEFLKVAEALCEIRRRRLYREQYVTFAEYVRGEFSLALSSANGMIRSWELAQNLIEDGVRLPPDMSPTAVRPLVMLPEEEGLRTSCWQFVQSLSPARCPSSTLVGRVARLIRIELDGSGEENGDGPEDELRREGRCQPPRSGRNVAAPSRERPFLGALMRLATFPSFNAPLIVSTLSGTEAAATVYGHCAGMIARLRSVQECILTSFPEVTACESRTTETAAAG